MINKIYSTLPTFKEVNFHDGLNIVIAEKTEESDSKQTRNGAGKSTLLEVINYILASNSDRSIFNKDPLKIHAYFMDLSIDGVDFTISRLKNKVTIKKYNKKHELVEEVTDDFKRMYDKLSNVFFPGKPTCVSFREALAFFLRKESDGGFLNVTEYTKHPVKKLVYNKILAYLLGLNPKNLSKWIKVVDKRKTYRDLKKIVKQNNQILGAVKLDKGYLRSEIVVLEDKIKFKEKEIADFNVLPTYKDYEKQANVLTEEINDITHDNFYINKNITELNKVLNLESKSNVHYSIKELYEDSKINLPDNVYKRYQDLEVFHKSVIENRKLHLTEELSQLKSKLTSNNKLIEYKSNEKQSIMRILDSNGALDQYSQLQDELNHMKSRLKILNNSLDIIQKMDDINKQTKEDLATLKSQIDLNIAEQKDITNQAILSIHHSLEELYGEKHIETFLIDSDEQHGLNIELSRPDGQSSGINKILIFCFDLMLMELNRALGRPLDFIFHDSHLFDGVDSRQVEKALHLIIEKSEQYDFQYIATMNSDSYSLFESDFSSHVVDITLTDETETGGILGMRI